MFKDVFKSKEDIDKYLFIKDDKGNPKALFNDLTDDYDKVNDGAVKGIGALRVKRSTLLTKVNKNFERGSKIEIIKEKGQERFSDDILETIYNIDQKLNSFYIGNDSDYFIHENLMEFLTQEKERYIKNYILSDLKSILDGKLDNTTIIIAKAFDLVGSRIIEFLTTIEEFQKKLFTMKKKVVESEYCLTIDNIDEKYYSDILKNKAQLTEWEDLFSVKVKTLADLKKLPTLVLDTKFFREKDGSNKFKDEILAKIEDLDEKTNGLLINSENYQALTLLQEKYRKRIKCIYTDPPYNAKSSQILYKNSFKHSSWATFMHNRIGISKRFLTNDGIFEIAIDDYEVDSLKKICDDIFNVENFIANVVVIHNPRGRNDDKFFGTSHEYMLTYSINKQNAKINNFKPDEDFMLQFNKEDEISLYGLTGYMRTGNNSDRVDRPNLFYPIFINPENNKLSLKPQNGLIKILPINAEGREKTWRWGTDTFLDRKETEILVSEKNGKWNLQKKRRFTGAGKKPKTIWHEARYDASSNGIMLMKSFFNSVKLFSYPKSIYTVMDALEISTDKNSMVMDYFSGSATTGHAILKLNKQDKGNRKYILIEMGTYFNTVTKSRMQKVIYSDLWQYGKPLNKDGSLKHIFKYQVLEQYEDVLDAIEQFGGETPKELPLKYLYKPELNQIQSTLDLSKPFSNKIKYGQPTKEGFVDLVDTYNYLQGYEVKSLKTYTINKKYYKVVETSDTLVIWRDIALKEDDSKAIIEIADKYPEVTAIDLNYDFNLLATEKGKQLAVGKRQLSVTIIHADLFNQ